MNGSGFGRPSATGRARSYILRETVIGIALNMAISAGFYWLAFGDMAEASAQGLVRDCISQSFMIALMSAGVPSLIARKTSAGERRRHWPVRKPFPCRPTCSLRALTIALPPWPCSSSGGGVLV